MKISELPILEEVHMVFREVFGDIPFALDVVQEIPDSPSSETYGLCDFRHFPPKIFLRADLPEMDLVENFCHELAHLACGFEAAHNQVWERARDELSLRFWSRRMVISPNSAL